MPTQVVALEASFDTSQAEGSVKSLKAQLKEAQADVQKLADKFGDTSAEAIKAAKRAAELKDKIGDAKALTDAFNPDQKFKALSSALSVVAGGFSAVQGAMGLFGSDSKELEKTMLKVQSAMAISQGLNSIGEAADAYKKLKASVMEYTIVQKISAVAQKVWNAVMAANPIGAIIAAIALLIAAATALYKYFSESSKAAKANEKAVKDNAKAVQDLSKQLDKNADTLQKNNDYKLAMAKASGASTKAIRALELKLIDEQIAMAASSREAAKNEYWKQKLALANLKAADADDELIKKQVENTNKAGELYTEQNANLNKAGEAKVALVRKQNVEITQEETNANKKSADDRKAASDKRKADADAAAQKVKEDTIANNEQLKSVKQELELAAIKDEDERAKRKIQLDFDNEKLKIQNSKGSTESKNALIVELEKKKNIDIQAVTDAAILKAAEKKKTDDEKTAADKLIKDEKDIEDAKKKTNTVRELTNTSFENEVQKIKDEAKVKYDIIKGNKEAEIALEEQTNSKIAALRQTKINSDIDKYKEAAASINGILSQSNANQLADLEASSQAQIRAAGDNKEAVVAIEQQTAKEKNRLQNEQIKRDKLFAIAEAIINTYKAAAQVFARPAAGDPVTSLGIKIATMVAAVAAGIKNVMAIRKVPMPSGGGAGGSGGGEQLGGIAAPIAPQASATTLNQMAINNAGNQAIKTYVVESDVSGNQERIDRIQRAARIGP